MESLVMLTILGKVSKKTMAKFLKTSMEVENSSWFFIDYSNDEIKVGKKFDTLLEGPEKKLIPNYTNIKLSKVFDQMGNSLEYIPKGFQTIAKLDFSDKVPASINGLPVFDTWDYNPEPITITQHEMIQLGQNPDKISKALYKLFLNEFKNNQNNRRSTFPRHILEAYIFTHYSFNQVQVQKVFNELKLYGLLKEDKDKNVELVTG